MDVSNFDVFNDGTTLVIINNGKENRFTERGIADLYKIVKSGSDMLRNACVIDKAVGKAAATLMILGGVKQVNTPRISTPALELLKSANVEVNYRDEVPLILNRMKSGSCPMESLCSESNDPEEIFRLIDNFINNKKHGSNS